ncbi:hypothetical protein NM688_g650 [Phlebia brevispora]|uniref:Uncharacterized protein n=1 Tax=Phlebia brevispora TaxID=194682 RepID=A0ACC1TDD7_9APHY|nr:hypothetical protein NM688_g650 [Phlebia brevispora]
MDTPRGWRMLVSIEPVLYTPRPSIHSISGAQPFSTLMDAYVAGCISLDGRLFAALYHSSEFRVKSPGSQSHTDLAFQVQCSRAQLRRMIRASRLPPRPIVFPVRRRAIARRFEFGYRVSHSIVHAPRGSEIAIQKDAAIARDPWKHGHALSYGKCTSHSHAEYSSFSNALPQLSNAVCSLCAVRRFKSFDQKLGPGSQLKLFTNPPRLLNGNQALEPETNYELAIRPSVSMDTNCWNQPQVTSYCRIRDALGLLSLLFLEKPWMRKIKGPSSSFRSARDNVLAAAFSPSGRLMTSRSCTAMQRSSVLLCIRVAVRRSGLWIYITKDIPFAPHFMNASSRSYEDVVSTYYTALLPDRRAVVSPVTLAAIVARISSLRLLLQLPRVSGIGPQMYLVYPISGLHPPSLQKFRPALSASVKTSLPCGYDSLCG